jgi:hypothetical protein
MRGLRLRSRNTRIAADQTGVIFGTNKFWETFGTMFRI